MSDTITLYISGPMSNYPELNFPAFNAVASDLRSKGYKVNNPAETSIPSHKDFAPKTDEERLAIWVAYMREDIKILMDSDKVAVLPGWRKSKGARLEVKIARELNMEIINAITLEPIEQIIRD